jgi:hypothetical protein
MRSMKSVFLVIVGWVLTAALGLVIVSAATRGHTAATARPGGSLPVPNLVYPLVNEQKATVASAPETVGFPVPLPDAAAASSGNLTQTWVNGAEQQVALVYDGGKLTIMMWPAAYADPASEFKTFTAENNADAAVGQVNGEPALIIQPGTDTFSSNPAWVEFERNGIDINVVSASYGTDTLLTVASSMK